MTEHVPQTTPEHWVELARLAEGDVRLAKAHHLQAITALLSDRDALEAECQRLRERAEVAEKAVELAASVADHLCDKWVTDGDCAGCPIALKEANYCASHNSTERWALEAARAALGVAPEPQAAPASAGTEGSK